MNSEQKFAYVILKTVERCNLNCSYCYFFNGGDESFKKHPPFIKEVVIEQVTRFLLSGIKDLGITKIFIAFHGGEPTLQPLSQFESMCSYFLKELSPHAEVGFGIQTNGTLISDRWIESFSKFNVSVGVSLDGPKEYNDLERVDHKGKGSYDAVRAGIDRLHAATALNKIKEIGILCVIDPRKDPRVIYRHFVDDLKISRMDFLLPDFTHDDFKGSSRAYGEYLCSLFDEWMKDNNPKITIRILESIIRILGGKESFLVSVGPQTKHVYALTISSNGELSPDDTLRGANRGQLMQISNVWNHSFKDFFDMPIFHALNLSKSVLPETCSNCCWQKICGGGSSIHRFSQKNGFDNPSIMCESLKMIYSHVSSFLLNIGYSRKELEKTLFGE